MNYTFERGRFNVHYLTAPYTLLVQAFGNDGDNPRDTYKCMAQWDLTTPHGPVEVYDYKVGTCYEGESGLERHEITVWHVQGSDLAIDHMLGMINASGGSSHVITPA